MKITLNDNKIINIQKYNTSMKKSLEEKAFFLEKIEATSFIDYGCADGALLSYIQSIKTAPSNRFMGYDIEPEMLKIAKENSEGILFTDNLDLVKTVKTDKSVLILSSIIHEIYSYDNANSFWKDVFDKIDTKYIVIRDMMIDNSQRRMSNADDVKKVRMSNNKLLEEYENNWGPIDLNKSLIQFLLKYRYTENWERELQENYLPLTVEQLIAKIPKNYRIAYRNHYTPSYLKNMVKKDFGIDLTEQTHLQMIIEKIE